MFACLLVSKIILNRLQNNFHEICRLRTGEKSLKFRTVAVRVSVGYPLLARNTKIDGGIPSTECSLVCACAITQWPVFTAQYRTAEFFGSGVNVYACSVVYIFVIRQLFSARPTACACLFRSCRLYVNFTVFVETVPVVVVCCFNGRP